jgi:ATP-dependent Zn protease
MNGSRFWRTALFPLVIIAALIWIGVQTLGDDDSKQKLLFSQALNFVRQHSSDIRYVTFHPSTQEVEFHFSNGKTATVGYPVDQSAYELQQLLESKNVPFDAKRTGSSAWWSILTSLLPFVLLFGFWIFLTQQFQKRKEGSDPGH